MKGFKSPIFKKFNTYNEAVDFVIKNGGKLDHKIENESSTNGHVQKDDLSHSTGSSSSTKSNKRLNDEPVDSKPNKKLKPDSGEIPVKRLNKYGKYSFLEDDNGFVHVFTDGSCEGNGTEKAVAGLGVYFGEGHAL